jgi:hypothetical protein
MRGLTLAQRKALVLPEDIKGIIVGMLLGDAYLHKKHWPNSNAYLLVEQKDAEFLQYIWDQFNTLKIVGASPRTRTRLEKRTGNTFSATYFVTLTLPLLTEFRKLWYLNIGGKNLKVLPKDMTDLLTPIALAFWCASDATFCKRYGVVVICTDSFTSDEVDILRSILLAKFDINSTRILNGSGREQHRIRIPKASIPTLQSLVAPHMPPTMRYRIGL